MEAAIGHGAVMSWINLAEVFYRVYREHGENEAESILANLRGLLTLDEASPERTVAAARIKARHPMALADCFATATAIAHRLPLLTGDPEILNANNLGCEVEDLRP